MDNRCYATRIIDREYEHAFVISQLRLSAYVFMDHQSRPPGSGSIPGIPRPFEGGGRIGSAQIRRLEETGPHANEEARQRVA